MANILQFRPAESAKPRTSMEIGQPRGEVVIFSGIRIERREPTPETPIETPRKRVRARKK